MTVKASQIVEEIKKEFFLALQAKTGWGRNDLMKLYDSIVLKIVMKYLE